METKISTMLAAGAPEGLSLPDSLLKRVPLEEIPASGDLFGAEELEQHLLAMGCTPFSLMAVGDVMLGGRSKARVEELGWQYPFRALAPLLKRSGILLGNLEGPLARKAQKQDRNFSYKVKREAARHLAEAGFKVLTLANNHLMDCGREGVLETLACLRQAGLEALGAGEDRQAAHRPVILPAGALRLGLLGYYWNRRCAATQDQPGGATDAQEELEADIAALRSQVDRVVVTFHWGIPYARQPLPEDRIKARWAIDCGADAVIGHHAHVIQPLEIHRERPIFYNVGNFTFGSGNSWGEGLGVGLRFEAARTRVEVFPLYVKNRDPRVNYQPKLLKGRAARRVLGQLKEISGPSGERLELQEARACLDLAWGKRGAHA